MSVLFGFGFGSAWMLPWLAAAAAPLVIHLWNRRRYREVPWAAMTFLIAALRKNSRRIQIEQWLLLAVRTAVVVLVVLALAEPFLEQTGLGLSGGARTHKVFVVDGSFSMDYKPGDRTLFARAKALAAQIVEESPQGDGFSLVLMAAPASSIVGEPSLDKRQIATEIDGLKLPHGGGDLPGALVLVEAAVAAAEKAGLTRHEIFFLTDLGRRSWSDEARGRQAAGELRQRIERLAAQAALVVMDLGQPGADNVAVASLALAEPAATVANTSTFQVQLRHFGSQPRPAQTVELLVDGRRVDERQLDLPAGGQATTAFSYQFESSGDHVVEARAPGDLLDVDNHRYLALGVRDSIRVLCVDGRPVGGLSAASEHLVLALNPEGRSVAQPLVVPEVAPESAIVERDLAAYDCVFLCNVAQLTANEARVLARYVERGGGLVVFLGDQVLAERYNQQVGPEGAMHLLPARIAELVPEGQAAHRFDPLGYRHRVVQAFEGREESGLLTTPVYQYYRLALPEQSRARVALAFEGGDPAIVEEAVGRGRSILVATDGSLSSVNPATRNPWTSWPAWPSFLPIVQELLAVAIAPRAADRVVAVGQPLGGALDGAAPRAGLRILTPEGPQPLSLAHDSSGAHWSWADTSRSGLYALEAGEGSSYRASYAVNVDTAESDLTKLDAAELPREFATSLQSGLDSAAGPAIGRRGELHPGLLYAAVLLMLGETLLAWRLAHSQQ